MRIIALLIPVLCASASLAASPAPEPAPGPAKLGVAGAVLLPDPINRKSVIAGSPDASTRPMHNDPDGKYAVGIWRCTPGSFRWTFGRDEFVYVIEGEATVTYASGKLITIRAGDAVYFPAGDCTWTISKTIKKVFAARE